ESDDIVLHDLPNATEFVLERNRVRAPGAPSRRHRPTASGGGSGGRVAAGAFRGGNTVTAAVTNTRVLESVEANITLIAGGMLAAIALLAFKYPRGIAYPVGVLGAWLAAAMLWRGVALYRNRRRTARDSTGASSGSTSRRPVVPGDGEPATQ